MAIVFIYNRPTKMAIINFLTSKLIPVNFSFLSAYHIEKTTKKIIIYDFALIPVHIVANKETVFIDGQIFFSEMYILNVGCQFMKLFKLFRLIFL